MDKFQAFVLEKQGDQAAGSIQTLGHDRLPDGEVTIRVRYSSINYKDAMAAQPVSPIVKSYPFVPGIDLAGEVVHSDDPSFAVGDEVLVTGYELGVSHPGGFSQLARVPADWVVPLPDGLTAREAMSLGTAGFTAALSVLQMERNGLRPEQGPVLVTGATGGVGSVVVSLLSKLGYRVTASTGKLAESEYLLGLGAAEVIERDALIPPDGKPLRKERWAGAVDPVGGASLPFILSTLRYGGSAAVSGLTGGADFATTVYPFILRGVKLLGIDSVYCDTLTRREVWSRLAADWKPVSYLETGAREIGLGNLADTLAAIRSGRLRGRAIVNLDLS
ncbi:acryloyl-CoA reductase [Paenibacillus validus]|uniref:acrylyl-CoA reductase family protein n=1 Tax=Paenibacillus validus TaxID=44253 RepID=UPI003D28FD78